MRKAKEEKNLIKLKRVVQKDHGLHTYEIANSRGNDVFYTITISSNSSCTCPDFMDNFGKNTCKHILWTMLHILEVPDDSDILQHISLTRDELQ